MNPNNQVEMVRAEMTFYADMFNKMTDLCFKKCVARFSEPELSTGELVCADRCVGKYVDTTNKVGEIMQAAQLAQNGMQPGGQQ